MRLLILRMILGYNDKLLMMIMTHLRRIKMQRLFMTLVQRMAGMSIMLLMFLMILSMNKKFYRRRLL